MNTDKDAKWLDELISHSIDTTKPRFDAEEWKKKHPDALQNILSRRTKPTSSRQTNRWKLIFAHPIPSLAAAAAVTIVVTGLFLTRDGQILNGSVPELRLVAQSPTTMVSMMSLRTTYQQGGWDALDRQFRDTLNTLGPAFSNLTMDQLLESSNGF